MVYYLNLNFRETHYNVYENFNNVYPQLIPSRIKTTD